MTLRTPAPVCGSLLQQRVRIRHLRTAALIRHVKATGLLLFAHFLARQGAGKDWHGKYNECDDEASGLAERSHTPIVEHLFVPTGRKRTVLAESGINLVCINPTITEPSTITGVGDVGRLRIKPESRSSQQNPRPSFLANDSCPVICPQGAFARFGEPSVPRGFNQLPQGTSHFTAVTRVQIPSGTPNLINELSAIPSQNSRYNDGTTWF